MPRTKVTKQAATKRPRNQMVEEAHTTAMREIQQKVDAYLLESNLVYEQNIDKINNHIRNLRTKLNPSILRMTLGDLFRMKFTNNMHDITASCNADMTSVSNLTTGGCFAQLSGLSSKSRGDEGKRIYIE